MKQLYRLHKEEWNSLTWKDVEAINVSIGTVFDNLRQKATREEKEDYKKRLLKRLHREKLLGKLMQKGPDI
jgi:hypothetical protein